MSDQADLYTVEVPAKKRGRPVSGTAKTAAQRKRDERERARSAIWEDDRFDLATTRALCDELPSLVSKGAWALVEAVTVELAKRARAASPQPANPAA